MCCTGCLCSCLSLKMATLIHCFQRKILCSGKTGETLKNTSYCFLQTSLKYTITLLKFSFCIFLLHKHTNCHTLAAWDKVKVKSLYYTKSLAT